MAAGWLESSVFDTGTSASNFTTISWLPTTQNASTTLQFQLASSNNSAGPWDYFGPDGTAASFYTVPGTNISTAHDNSRYVRYKAYLVSTNPIETPVLTSLQLNYVSGCFTPGQVYFGDLTAGSNYDLNISLAGFQPVSISGINITSNQSLEVLMSP
jgi:hypothetical protein